MLVAAARPHRIVGLDRDRAPLDTAPAEGAAEVRAEGLKLPSRTRVRRWALTKAPRRSVPGGSSRCSRTVRHMSRTTSQRGASDGAKGSNDERRGDMAGACREVRERVQERIYIQ